MLDQMKENNLKKNLAENLIRLRSERGLTQESLVSELNKMEVDISRTALASYENQRSFPRLDVMYSISNYFDTDISSMLEEYGSIGNVLGRNAVARLDLDDLLSDYSTVLVHFKMYRNMYFNLAEKIMHESDSEEERKKWLKNVTAIYAQEQMKEKELQNDIKDKLDPLEAQVFMKIQDGVSVQELAKELALNPSQVTEAFIHAKDKIFDLLLT